MCIKNLYNISKVLFFDQLAEKEFDHIFIKVQGIMKRLQFNFIENNPENIINHAKLIDSYFLRQLVFQQQFRLKYLKENNLELWLALISIYLNDKNPSLALASLRLSGVRSFLHPRESSFSPFFLAGLYTFIQLQMRNLTTSFLFNVRLSPFCELGTTMSRTNLLVNLNNLEKEKELVEEFSSFFRMIHPALKVDFYTIPLKNNDFTSHKFIQKTIKCNAIQENKREYKSIFYKNSYSFSYKKIKEEIINAQHMILEKDTKIVISFLPENNLSILFSLGYPLESEIFFEKESIFPKIEDICISSKPLASIVKNYPDYGIARLDVAGFLKNSLNQLPPGATSLQNYRYYHQFFFQKIIPEIVKLYNLKENGQIFIMYSLLDDCALLGPLKKLKLVAENLKQLYKQKWQGSLKCGFGRIENGTTAADLSFQSLSSMRVI